MSNSGSPAVPVSTADDGENGEKEVKTGSSGDGNQKDSNNGSGSSGNGVSGVAPHLDPVVRLNHVEVSEAQLKAIRKKILKGGEMEVESETISETAKPAGTATPNNSKPRRLSVHFAPNVLDPEMKTPKAGPSSITPDRTRQDSGGSSRKHRSRKEKLVCRSESPSDIGMDTSENSSRGTLPAAAAVSSSSSSMGLANPVSILADLVGPPVRSEIPVPPVVMKPPDIPAPAPPVSMRSTPASMSGGRVVKSHALKRSSSVSTPGSASSRRSSPLVPVSSGSFKEPMKKKKVIEIVSPRKRKMDHFDLVKTSSDPIFVRAAIKPYKLKNKSHHNRLKFSRANLSKYNSGQQSGSSRVRRESSASLQQNSMGAVINKSRLNIPPPVSQEVESENQLPSAFVDELLWVMEEADKEFDKGLTRTGSVSTSHAASFQPAASDVGNLGNPSFSAAHRFSASGRRRVESEPAPAVGFEMAPNSPSGSQSFYHMRKEIYFSPSPSYAAPGPSGRRRYSRRRHARIHPPFDNTNCNFQSHFCPNSKIPGSQYCAKHLDQGPASGYSFCRYMKDGRQCGNVFPSYDPALTYCEEHAHNVALIEHEKRNPTVQPDPARNIITKISQILSEGLTKPEVEGFDTSNPVILQIAEEPEIVQELPLGSFTGGQLEECDSEGERILNPDKPDYDSLKNAGYYTTEEVIQIHINKLRKLKALYQREKELEWLTRQHKFRFYKESLEKLKHCGPRFTTNPYLIDKSSTELPKEYIDHQIKQYEAAKAILQTAYRADGQRGLLRLKMLKKAQDLERMAKASGQKQHDAVDIYDSESDVDSDSGEPRERRESTRHAANKPLRCAYNEGYAIRACPNPPVYWSQFCFKHILSDTKQVQWIPCGRSIGPDPQDVCKTPVLRVLEKHGCPLHAPLVMTKHKPLRKSEEDLTQLLESENEEEDVTLESEATILENLVSDECVKASHLEEAINQLLKRGPLEITDTSDSEETDEEGIPPGAVGGGIDDVDSPIPSTSLRYQKYVPSRSSVKVQSSRY